MKITEVQLYTSNPDELKNFYTDILGLGLISENPAGFSVAAGATVLTFMKSEYGSEPYYHFAVNIPQNQIEDAAGWLKQKVKLIETEGSPIIDFPNWNAHSVYFYDPAGNIVELIARHNLGNSSEEAFGPGSLLNISEIGMPASSVNNLYSLVSSMMGEKLWWGNLETFCAVGNEEGLFIIVSTNRNWFPTDKPSVIFPITIKIKSKGAASMLDFGNYKILHDV